MNPNFDKREYKQLQKLAIDDDVYTMCRKTKTSDDYNGITIAYYKPNLAVEDARMIYVSVSYCSPEDEFSKKHGKFTVLSNVYAQRNIIQLPLADYWNNFGPEAVGCFLLKMFEI